MVIDDRTVPEDDEVDSVINRLDVLHDPSHIRDYRASEWTSQLEEAGLRIETVRLYRKHIPLTHFTEMVDHPTARKMQMVATGITDEAKAMMHFEGAGEKIALDNMFVLIAAVK